MRDESEIESRISQSESRFRHTWQKHLLYIDNAIINIISTNEGTTIVCIIFAAYLYYAKTALTYSNSNALYKPKLR